MCGMLRIHSSAPNVALVPRITTLEFLVPVPGSWLGDAAWRPLTSCRAALVS